MPFQVQFPPATVFATYHSDGRQALKRLRGVPAKDLNQVFNEPPHFSASVTGVEADAIPRWDYHGSYPVN